MTKVSIRAHRFSLMWAVAAVVSLGWSPLQAFAADATDPSLGAVASVAPGPVDAVSNTVSNTAPAPVNTVSNTVSNAAPGPVNTVTNAAPGPVNTVSNTVSNAAPGPVNTVSNTASGTVGTVSNTGSGTGTVSNSASGTVSSTGSGIVETVSNAVGDAVSAVKGAVGGTPGTAQTDHLSAVAGATPSRSSSRQQTTAMGRSPLLRPQSLHDDLVLLAERSQAGSAIGDEGHGACVAAANATCQAADGRAGSWTRSVADIIRRLLALTGWGVLPWIVASCFLTLAGMLSLYQARDRSELGLARPS